jgi:hypothetical protein
MKSKRHQERVENGSEELRIYFECKNCKKEYETKSGLYRHNKYCIKVEESPPNSSGDYVAYRVSSEEAFSPPPINVFDDTVIRQKLEEISMELQTPMSNKLINIILDKTKLIEDLHTKMGDVVIPNYMNTPTSKFEYNGFSIEYKTEERMIHGVQLCEACNVNLLDWYSSENLKSEDPWLNMNQAFELAGWISTNLLLELAKWFYTMIETTTKEKDLRIKLLEDMYVNKQSRKDFSEKPVVYMLTTEDNKNKRIYIIGKSINLKNRLSSYNKTAEHEVVYYRECKDEETMSLSENMILKKLRMYREKANRDRFILPDEKEITDFVNVIDECLQFFE